MIDINKVVMTCSACPSQWALWDTEGNEYYARYRYSNGTINLADDILGVPIYSWNWVMKEGSKYGGVMSTEQLFEEAKEYFQLTENAVIE